jgi:Fur family peroxide stress response transcriptional regulator
MLHGNQDHPTAEAIWQVLRAEHPGLSLSTVYKTLEALEALGEVRSIRTISGGRAGDGRLHFDPHTDPHHHAVCRACGRIQDVAPELVVRLDQRAAKTPVTTGLAGFVADGHQIVFTGRWGDCS